MQTKKTILLVDDEVPLLGALKAKFESRNFSAVTCANGADAIHILETQRFDVVVTDLHMPNVDGYAVIHAAKKSQSPTTPVFVITNLGFDGFCERALDLGAEKCFIKSEMSLHDVVEVIDRKLAAAA